MGIIGDLVNIGLSAAQANLAVQATAAEIQQTLDSLNIARENIRDQIAETTEARRREVDQAQEALKLQQDQARQQREDILGDRVREIQRRGEEQHLSAESIARQVGDLAESAGLQRDAVYTQFGLAYETLQGDQKLRALAHDSYQRELSDMVESKTLVQKDFARQLGDLEENRQIGAADRARLADELRVRESQAIADIDRQVSNLSANRDAGEETIYRYQRQLVDTKDNTLEGLRARAAFGEAEAGRKINQMQANERLFLDQTKDAAILELNHAGSQAKFAVGRAEEQQALTVGTATARAAASGLRRGGTPLLALRQAETDAKAEAEQTRRAASYAMESTALGTRQRVQGARAQTAEGIATVTAGRAAEDLALRIEQQRVELSFNQQNENLGATRQDLDRQYNQDRTALAAVRTSELTKQEQGLAGITAEGQQALLRYQQTRDATLSQQDSYLVEYSQARDARMAQENETSTAFWLNFEQTLNSIKAQRRLGLEDITVRTGQKRDALMEQKQANLLDYQYDIQSIRDASGDAIRSINDQLAANVLATSQRQADVRAESDVLTASYRRQMAEANRQRTNLINNRSNIMLGVALGGVSGILSASEQASQDINQLALGAAGGAG